MFDILKDIIDILKTDTQTDRGVEDIHLSLLLRCEVAEDCGIGMDSKRTVIEEVRGTVHELQTVEEVEAGILTLEINAYHGTSRLAELLLCKGMKLIILQAYIVDELDLLERLQFLCQFQGVRRLYAIAGIKRLQSHGLKESSLRRHVSAEVEE